MPCTLPAVLADAAVCRGSFHAVLRTDVPDTVFSAFSAALQKAQADGSLLTASLFRCESHLFFYAEGLNRPFTPQGLCPALDAALLPWPPALGGNFTPPMGRHAAVFLPRYPHHRRRLAAGALPAAPPGTHCLAAARQMVQLYGAPSAHCHRGAGRGGSLAPDLRTGGRAVFLSRGTAHHVNIRHQPGAHSPELDAWIAADPESHFARFTPEQKAHPDGGHNFVFLPRIAGTED